MIAKNSINAFCLIFTFHIHIFRKPKKAIFSTCRPSLSKDDGLARTTMAAINLEKCFQGWNSQTMRGYKRHLQALILILSVYLKCLPHVYYMTNLAENSKLLFVKNRNYNGGKCLGVFREISTNIHSPPPPKS